MLTYQEAVERSFILLQWAFGLTLILIGADKVFQTNILVEWTQYVGPLAQSTLPVEPVTFVIILGVAEMLVGAALLFTRYTRLIAYIIIAVLALIIINLINMGLYDIAARDALLALGALVLSWLAQAREE